MPTALVTGASRGIGRQVCRTLAARGWQVFLTARSRELAENTEQQMEEVDAKVAEDAVSIDAARGSITPLYLDESKEATIIEAAKEIEAQGVKLDTLVNNAAIFEEGWNPELFERTMRVNLLGPVQTIKHFSPLMANNGHIINVSSWFGQLKNLSPSYREEVTSCQTIEDVLRITFREDKDMENAGHGCYRLSKACLNRITQLMANRPDFVQRHIKILACCPGWVQSDMGGKEATRSIPEGATSILALTEQTPNFISGGFYRDGKPFEF